MGRPDEWITYERYGSGTEKMLLTLPATETPCTGYSASRPATKAEIAAEKRKRRARDKANKQREQFMARPEYQDAQMIASTLELMEYNNNPLDRLTPEEWRKLRQTICG